MGCVVCGKTTDLVKCASAGCKNLLCFNHVMRYEISDAEGMRVEGFCSRECYIRTVRRGLPAMQEIYIALIVIVVSLAVYFFLLRAATQNL